jgi:hypothetical protein
MQQDAQSKEHWRQGDLSAMVTGILRPLRGLRMTRWWVLNPGLLSVGYGNPRSSRDRPDLRCGVRPVSGIETPAGAGIGPTYDVTFA